MQDHRLPPPLPGEVRIEDTFGERVREERTAQRMSQATLAARAREQNVDGAGGATVKLDDTAIARVEHASRSITLAQAVAIAHALEVPLDYLLRPSDRATAEQALREAEREVTDFRSQAHMATTRADIAEERAQRLRQIVAENARKDSDSDA